MKKALIIGINGFAGSYLRRELTGIYDVYGADINSFDDRVRAIDMLDEQACDKLFEDIKPDYVFNLAGQASPMISWEKTNFTMHLNVDLSVNIVKSCAVHCPQARILLVGSANQYDMNKVDGELVTESTPLVNDSPYSVSKNTQEALINLYARKYKLQVIFTRSFNHVGRGQRVGFVLSDYSSRIAALEAGEIETFKFGNLNSWRDFSDARDVAHAYRLIAEKGNCLDIYNVGSGTSYYIFDLVKGLIDLSPKASAVTVLPERLDESELVHYKADISKLQLDTGFVPQYNVYDILPDILAEFRSNIQASRGTK